VNTYLFSIQLAACSSLERFAYYPSQATSGAAQLALRAPGSRTPPPVLWMHNSATRSSSLLSSTRVHVGGQHVVALVLYNQTLDPPTRPTTCLSRIASAFE
jgi:hypothetical protein